MITTETYAPTVWSDPVVLVLVILVTVVRGDKEMFLTERLLAVVAFEG
jgi:hypothetical protein